MFGRPVIGSAAGGLGERIRDGSAGLTFPLGDAEALSDRVVELCGDEATWKHLSEAIVTPPSHLDMLSGYERLWRQERAELSR